MSRWYIHLCSFVDHEQCSGVPRTLSQYLESGWGEPLLLECVVFVSLLFEDVGGDGVSDMVGFVISSVVWCAMSIAELVRTFTGLRIEPD